MKWKVKNQVEEIKVLKKEGNDLQPWLGYLSSDLLQIGYLVWFATRDRHGHLMNACCMQLLCWLQKGYSKLS